MKIDTFFNRDLTINWEKVWSIPEFKRLQGCKQNTVWHQEGDVAAHTKLVCDEIVKHISKDSDKYKKIVTAALCHDLGKATTTYWNENEQQWKCKSHGNEGARITRRLLYDEDILTREYICAMVEYHMVLHHIFDGGDEKAEKKMIQLSKEIPDVEDMILLNYCDSAGSKNSAETLDDIKGKIDRQTILYKKISAEKVKEETFDFTVYLMIGIPGAGKNYYIKTTEELKNLPTVSRDDIRIEIGLEPEQQGTPEQENKVTNILNNRIKKYAENKQSFIINNTNLKRKYRNDYKNQLSKYGNIKWVYIYVESPSLETNFERRKGNNWKKVINRMLDNFEFPSGNEYSELMIQPNFEDTEYKVIPLIDFGNF